MYPVSNSNSAASASTTNEQSKLDLSLLCLLYLKYLLHQIRSFSQTVPDNSLLVTSLHSQHSIPQETKIRGEGKKGETCPDMSVELSVNSP